MVSDLILIHRPGGKGRSTLAADLVGDLGVALDHGLAPGPGAASGPWFSWQTCLRQIAVIDELGFELSAPRLLDDDEVHRGVAAYRFLLEVICGLHSPLVGETEVYGQFKNAVSRHQFPPTPAGSRMKRAFAALFEDAKKIRQAHLEDLGSQSYGSVLRRELKGQRRIHVLGAGQLVAEMLPWIAKDGNEVHVYARDVVKARRELLRTGVEVRVHAIDESVSLAEADALVIAAPVSAEWLGTWLPSSSQPKIIADLRADSATDSLVNLRRESRLVGLHEVFDRIAANQSLISARKAAALEAIETAVRERNSYVEYRPFGWEDVCA